ncbi:MAG: hypothetical protein H7A53_01395 [Akkermansiaceae bacterium]|nr:hypothetical protein [Akkermansiaceae bacterium]
MDAQALAERIAACTTRPAREIGVFIKRDSTPPTEFARRDRDVRASVSRLELIGEPRVRDEAHRPGHQPDRRIH